MKAKKIRRPYLNALSKPLFLIIATYQVTASLLGLFDPVSSASKSEEVDRIISNIFTNYKKDVHPSTSRMDGAIEVGLSIIPLFIEVVT